jgi:UDP-glucose 4-epimerase
MPLHVLVTGGAGYIGSHTVLSLLEFGYEVTVIDNLCNSSLEAIKRVESLTGQPVTFVKGDITDGGILGNVFSDACFDSVIHFAGLKAVGESFHNPLDYYINNVYGTLCLIRQMYKHKVMKLVFSSSATVYGLEAPSPYVETLSRGTTFNPYGESKAMVERVLEDFCNAHNDFSAILLRYFNPIGAHESGLIGEDPQGIPNNLMPFMAQVAVGRREKLSVFGGDYSTHDGTCRRDYLHVMDLSEGHVAALEYLARTSGCQPINLGTGSPVSVLEMISAFKAATGIDIPYEIVERRSGDLSEFWADASKANDCLGWVARRDLEQMMRDTWRWQSNNPDGYEVE